jgi:protein-tyrosine-phosphatase
MAEGLMKALVKGMAEDWRIESAGVWAIKNSPAAENTLKVLLERGVDLSDHVSRQVTLEMVEEFNVVLTMESNHQEALQAAFPQHEGRIFTMGEMVGRQGDVVDPIGFPPVVFEQTAREIEAILSGGFERISRLAEGLQDDGIPPG